MSTADYTPIDEIPKIHAKLRTTFRSHKTKPLAYRLHQLAQLALFVRENSDALADCLLQDLGRPKQEAILADIAAVYARTVSTAEKLEGWMKEGEVEIKTQDWQQSWKPRIEKHAKGVVLIIAPWNYPIILSLQPLYGAIAAGCCAVIKASELAPHYASFLKANLHKYLDSEAYEVVLGAVPEISKVLELKWDHIFYTGNGRVGRIIAAAAAKHLTPLTLELGGKSPVLIDASADIPISTKRIIWAKINNSGQICIAPDFILTTPALVPSIVDSLRDHLKSFYPDGAIGSKDFSRIVSKGHFERLKGLLKDTKGEVVIGGQWDEGKLQIEPTVVVVKEGDVLLQDELFGPILPILAVESIDAAIEYLADRDHPLVLYAFAKDEDVKKKIVANTMSGMAWIGDCFQPVSCDELPFGGVGESGYGRQTMKRSFEEFVYERAVLDVPFEDEKFFGGRYPPYTAESLAFFSGPLSIPIPTHNGSAASK